MELNEEGLYEKLFHSVPAGNHEFKITDGTWDQSWGKDGGSANYTFTTESHDVTITFNATTREIKVALSDPTSKPVDETANYYVAGSAGLCGAEWDPGYEGAKLTRGADGLYTKLFQNIPAGTYEFKITAGDWTRNWGAGGAADGANIKFTLEEEKRVLITFNAETKAISYKIKDLIAEGWSGYTTWVLTSDGTITFTSSGEKMDNGESNMKNYWKVDGVLTLPWGEYAELITKVVIEDGINDIGQMAFYELPNLVEVVLPESAVEIREYTFKNCKSLITINLEVVEYIREGAFYGCAALEDITFADDVKIEDWAFSRTNVVLP